MVCFLVRFGKYLYGGVSGLNRFQRSGMSFKSMRASRSRRECAGEPGEQR
eukprot:CAMPEP_0175637418 /NCGR_PEP_ID=MMETSP0097-20121207/2704_1 /TAXON_ID=311494 /ORGANISM="Alexandrium monilatum, Strain CCMP3105" /LENGTH=49 /DNA_ID= /DNA_START= /DNA_END= /DNA_ORIENTATION=